MAYIIPAFVILVIIVAQLDFARVKGGKLLGSAGAITYGMYLVHMPMIIAALIYMQVSGDSKRALLSESATLVSYVSVVAAVSVLVYRYFELPLNISIRARLKAVKREQAPEASEVNA
jgi:peptidoglycan/LPS O-acetylase OafA/YrhL